MQTSRPPCPICRKPASADARPFCSKRCADVDLHRWLSGSYSVPGSGDEEDEPADPNEDEGHGR